LNAQFERLLCVKLFGEMTAGERQKSNGSPFGGRTFEADLDLPLMPVMVVKEQNAPGMSNTV